MRHLASSLGPLAMIGTAAIVGSAGTLGCAGDKGDSGSSGWFGGGGDGGGDAGGDGGGTHDSAGWFSIEGSTFEVSDAACGEGGASWGIAGVGFDEDGNYAAYGHELLEAPTASQTYTITDAFPPTEGQVFFYVRLGNSPVFGAPSGSLAVTVASGAVAASWSEVPIYSTDVDGVTGTSSGAVDCPG